MPITISGDSPNFTSVAATTVNGVTTLNSSSGVLATQNGMTGIAKAWVNFNGTTASPSTIRDSFNVASVTKNGTGDYTINFTTAMPNANYAVVVGAGEGLNSARITNSCARAVPTTSATRIGIQSAGGADTDATYTYVAVFSS